MNARLPLLLAGVLLAGTTPYAGAGGCAVEAMRAGAESYMAAMIEGAVDPTVWDAVPLAENARRVEHPPGTYNGTPLRGGPVTGKTGDEIKAVSVSLPTLRVTTAPREHDRPDRQWFDTESCEMVAFWLVDLGMRTPDGPENFGTVHIAERFRFRPSDTAITQIEAYYFQELTPDAQTCWPNAGQTDGTTGGCLARVPETRTHCAPSSEQRMRAAVDGYLDALRTRDPSRLELADEVRRTEMPWPAGTGPVTATDADTVRRTMANDPRFTSVRAVREERFFVDRHSCTVVAFYLLDADAPAPAEPGAPDVPYTVHVAQRFHVSQGRIAEMELITYPHQNELPEGSCWTGFDNEAPDPAANAADYAYYSVPCPAGY